MDRWNLSLFVEADDEGRLLTPGVRIAGGTPFATGYVRANLVDPDEALRGTSERTLRPGDIGAEVPLPPVPVPEGVPVEAALRWCWDVAVETDLLERIRWRRYLEVEARIGRDGEIVIGGSLGDLCSKAEDEGWGPEAPWDARDTDRLLESLVVDGIITEADRRAVIAQADASERTIERTLVELGHVGERALLDRYADITGSELLELDTYPIDPWAAERVPDEVARHFGLVAVGYHGESLAVAMSDPQNATALRAVQWIDHPYPPYIAVATRDDVLRALDHLALVAADRP